MFGMSWTQIIMIVVIGVFLLGPERIPTAVQWVTGSMKKLRGMAQGAQQQLNSELGPEIAEMRRQIAELQGLKEMQSLKELRDLNPRAMITKTIFGTDEAKTAGGVAGLLGLDPTLLTDPNAKGVSAGGPAEVTARAEQNAVSFDKSASDEAASDKTASEQAAATPGPTTSDPLPLVGGAQQQVVPAAVPDPMPQVGGAEQAVSDPMPQVSAAEQQAVPDLMPQVGGAEQAAPDPVPSLGASDPLPSVATGAPAPVGPTPMRKPARVPAPPARDQRPLVPGGDPLPRIAMPDPLPTASS